MGATRQATRQTVDSAGVPDEKAGDFNELLTTTIDVTRAIKTGYQSSSLWDSGCHHGAPLRNGISLLDVFYGYEDLLLLVEQRFGPRVYEILSKEITT